MTELSIQEILQDLLICEKFMITMYKQFAIELSNVDLQDLFIENMEDTFDIQHLLFLEMKERELYPVENAPMEKIDMAIKTIKDNSKYYDDTF